MSKNIKFPIYKNAVAVRISEDEMAFRYRFARRGHIEQVTPAPEDIAKHQRAKELLAELEQNPYISLDGYDADLRVTELETQRWVPDETREQWLARFREWRAANPEAPEPDPWQSMVAAAFSRAMDRSVVAGLIETSPGAPNE